MVFQWFLYRRNVRGANFAFLSLVVFGFALASLWLVLNVVRFYTYNPESGRIWAWHTAIVRVQTPLVWLIAILVVIVFVWALLLLTHWAIGRSRALFNKANP